MYLYEMIWKLTGIKGEKTRNTAVEKNLYRYVFSFLLIFIHVYMILQKMEIAQYLAMFLS